MIQEMVMQIRWRNKNTNTVHMYFAKRWVHRFFNGGGGKVIRVECYTLQVCRGFFIKPSECQFEITL